MNPMYGQVANAYSGEMQDTVRLNAGLDQQRAQFPNTLYDRFMGAYQQEYLRRKQEAEIARRQQHEDTYLKMAQEDAKKNEFRAKSDFATWISSGYKEGENDAEAMLRGRAAGHTPEEIRSMLPRGKTTVSGGESIQTSGLKGAPSLAGQEDGSGLGPLPTGQRAPIDITMPKSVEFEPGVGAVRGRAEAELRLKQERETRMARQAAQKMSVDAAELEISRAAAEGRATVNNAQMLYLTAQANKIKREIDSGLYDMKDDLLRMQIENLRSLIHDRGVDNARADARVTSGPQDYQEDYTVDAMGNRIGKKRTYAPPKAPTPTAAPAAGEAGGKKEKKVVKKFHGKNSEKTKTWTKFVYSDGTEKVVEGEF